MMDLSANRPTRFMSSPCPAIPTTRVPKISGTMMDLIIRRKTVDTGLSVVANSGAYTPISTPTTIEIMIHDVSVMRLKFRNIIAILLSSVNRDYGRIGGGGSTGTGGLWRLSVECPY